jgi:hypothetical protein
MLAESRSLLPRCRARSRCRPDGSQPFRGEPGEADRLLAIAGGEGESVLELARSTTSCAPCRVPRQRSCPAWSVRAWLRGSPGARSDLVLAEDALGVQLLDEGVEDGFGACPRCRGGRRAASIAPSAISGTRMGRPRRTPWKGPSRAIRTWQSSSIEQYRRSEPARAQRIEGRSRGRGSPRAVSLRRNSSSARAAGLSRPFCSRTACWRIMSCSCDGTTHAEPSAMRPSAWTCDKAARSPAARCRWRRTGAPG